MIDIHSHVLPGVDDGSRNFDESIETIKWLFDQGVTDLIATPHYVCESDYTSPRSKNLELLRELQARLKAAGIDVKLYLGNEIYINERIPELLEAGELSPLADSEYLLVELPLNSEFPNYEGYLCELREKGFKVVLAHPERYSIVQDDFQKVRDLYEDGILLQSNLRSIIGTYGNGAERVIKKLAREKMIFAFGSDTHRTGRSDYLIQARKKLLKYYNPRELALILDVNLRKKILR
ncbi:hypothetical protein IKF92_02710 [Candidatus Saccharibacteria bacterium]|nr:hypothetical protein [Candidatus Saccharibacteria bacterium]